MLVLGGAVVVSIFWVTQQQCLWMNGKPSAWGGMLPLMLLHSQVGLTELNRAALGTVLGRSPALFSGGGFSLLKHSVEPTSWSGFVLVWG